MELRGDRVYLRPLQESDAEPLLALRIRNRDFFRPWEPVPPPNHFTLEAQRAEIERAAKDAEQDRRYAFAICRIDDDRLVGRITLSNVARGAWQNATLGYYIDERENGRGYATEAVRLAIRFAFEVARLHRVQAGVVPENAASVRVLEKAGFRREGYSKNYLKLDDAWRDHEMFAITVEDLDSA